MIAYLIESNDGRSGAYAPVFFLLYFVDYDMVLSDGVDDERLGIWAPGHVRSVVKVNVHAQRLVLLLAQIPNVP